MEEDNITADSDKTVAIEDMQDDGYADKSVGDIVGLVKGKYNKAETARRGDEERWIQA